MTGVTKNFLPSNVIPLPDFCAISHWHLFDGCSIHFHWFGRQPGVTKWARTARAAIQKDNRGRGQTSYKSGRTVLHFGPVATIATTIWFNYSSNAELRSCARFLPKAGGPTPRTNFRCNWKDSSIRSTWENCFSFHVNLIDTRFENSGYIIVSIDCEEKQL